MTSAAGDFDHMVQQATDKLREIEQKVKELFDKVNGLLDWVPSFLSDLIKPIQQALGLLNEKMQEFWKQVDEFFTEPGSVSALHNAADTWAKQVSPQLGALAGTLTLDQLRTDDEWKGKAADAYKNTVPAQSSALGAIKDIGNQLNTSLTNLANALIAFWVAIGLALVAFVVGLVGAIAACCTVVGAPAGVAAAATTAGVVIGLISAAIAAFISYNNGIQTEQAALGQKLSDDSQFPNGAWPVSTADLADESRWQVSG